METPSLSISLLVPFPPDSSANPAFLPLAAHLGSSFSHHPCIPRAGEWDPALIQDFSPSSSSSQEFWGWDSQIPSSPVIPVSHPIFPDPGNGVEDIPAGKIPINHPGSLPEFPVLVAILEKLGSTGGKIQTKAFPGAAQHRTALGKCGVHRESCPGN